MDIKNLANTLHPLERKVIVVLDKVSSFDDIVKETGLKDVEVMRALQWLANKELVNVDEEIKELVYLDKNGESYVIEGLPEIRFLKMIKTKEMDSEALQKEANLSKEEFGVSVGMLKKKAAILVSKKGNKLIVKITDNGKKLLGRGVPEEEFLKKDFPVDYSLLKDLEKFAYDNLRKRKNIIKTEIVKLRKANLTSLGGRLAKNLGKGEGVIDTLTPKIIGEGSWKNKQFRRYDIKINVPAIFGGKRHFVNQAIEYIKRIWLDLGFKEMEGNLVQTSFWDMDSLFVPQDHPARDMQDTFYIKEPKQGKLPSLCKNIKEVHENGGNTGSKGWQSKWSEERAKDLLLRTHTTVLSAQTISKLKKEDMPAKFFSVGKVFRNETLDWKHLFEFYQVEGIVVDPDANMKNLKGYLREFFGKMGYPDVRMRPAHFPYTSPSCEVDVLHPIHKEWIELGGAGIFRPEVVKPLLGFDCPVLAWGLGLERIISDYFQITDIRQIYGNNIKQLHEMKQWLK